MSSMRNILIILVLLSTNTFIYAQDDLLGMLNEEQPKEKEFKRAIFKGTRIINGHSVETRRAGVLEFIISHRFGTLNSGAYQLFGLDQSNIRLALEYAISDRLMIGAGRSSFEKTYDGFFKYRLLRQQTGIQNIPFSITWFSSTTIKTLKRFDEYEATFSQKMAYTNQMLIASKLSDGVSLQLSPTMIHYNLIELTDKRNMIYAVGFGGRVKVSQRITINGEYFYRITSKGPGLHNAIALGVDIETGGHVFQFQLSNATAMIEKSFIGETSNDFFNGDIHFGFNISRAFQLKK